jgi:hypothetical protein
MLPALFCQWYLIPTGLSQHKVAIPQLQRPGHGKNMAKDRRRITQACTTVLWCSPLCVKAIALVNQ